MKKEGYYSSGDFARKAHVTKKTLRYYDEHNILRPSYVNENGARFYTDNDFARLQQILFLKYLSFSLNDIKEMTVRNEDTGFWEESLRMQTNLVSQQIDQLTMMRTALEEAQDAVRAGSPVDWSRMLELVNRNELEEKLKKQYLNSSNIEARIKLHRDYSANKQGWFPWLFEQCKFREGEQVLELGCGDASFWVDNKDRIPQGLTITLTDISNGIVKEAAKRIGKEMIKQNTIPAEDTPEQAKQQFQGQCKQQLQQQLRNPPYFNCEVMDARHINAADASMDVVIANHVLFYCEDLYRVFSEVRRVLKPGGRFLCSTYSSRHMQEVSQLVQEFDDRICLSADILYERFGKDNGAELLQEVFSDVRWLQYEDSLIVDHPEPLIAYILSCHGNQNRFIVDHYHEFYHFVRRKTDSGFRITKDAGAFLVKK